MPTSSTASDTVTLPLDNDLLEEIMQAFHRAANHHQEGRLQQAAELYRAILKVHPRHPETNHGLGMLAVQSQRAGQSLPYLEIALQERPEQSNYWLHFIDALLLDGQLGNAKQVLAFGQAHGLQGAEVDDLLARMAPSRSDKRGDSPPPHDNEQSLPKTTTSGRSALDVFKRTVAAPSDKAMNALVNLHNQGQTSKAEARAKALTLRFPEHGFGWKVLGNVLHTQGRVDEALQCMEKAARFLPDDHVGHNNLGVTLLAKGRPVEAEASLRRALVVKPDYPDAHTSLGMALLSQDRLAEAEASLRIALTLRPEHAGTHINLGAALQDQDKLSEAEASFRQALELTPENSYAHNNLGLIQMHQGHLAEAQASFRHALDREPRYLTAADNLLFLLNYTSAKQAECLSEARRYGQQVGIATTFRFDHWLCDPQPARLRIGFVSGDLNNHPVGFFLESLLAHLDQSRFELIAYPTVNKEDDLTARIKPYFFAWRPLTTLSDDEAANVIHTDGVHVLIDLSGHTRNNRLPVFSRRPAPVQASWMGYFATTGLPEMDYILGDPHVAPHSEAEHFTEKLWQLPESYLCFTAPQSDVVVAPLPALSTQSITFGCFNNLTKVNDAVVAVWAAILMAVPSSRLYLKSKQFADAAMREATAQRFAGHGVARERLIIEANSARAQHLADYNRVDIALDPFPYPGGTTSIEGLWMGVPVITLRGDRFLSHIGETIAHNAGLPDWIAADKADYIAKAIDFAEDLDRLAKLRAGLRQQVLASPLFLAPRFARHFEDAVQGMWQKFQLTEEKP